MMGRPYEVSIELLGEAGYPLFNKYREPVKDSLLGGLKHIILRENGLCGSNFKLTCAQYLYTLRFNILSRGRANKEAQLNNLALGIKEARQLMDKELY